MKRLRECPYCVAPVWYEDGDVYAVCNSCGRGMELPRLSQQERDEEQKLTEQVAKAREASEAAQKAVIEATDAFARTQSQADRRAQQTAEANQKELLSRVDELSRMLRLSQAQKKKRLFENGEREQKAGRFDEAIRQYQGYLNYSEEEAEPHWRIALCRFGVEYVQEPETGRHVPTIVRLAAGDLLQDPDYQAALSCAQTPETRAFYTREAENIAGILNKYRELSATEKPYDVFISLKQSDGGKPTQEKVDGVELYGILTEKYGLRVFNSSITLKDKVGEEYEPYIMNALMTARVMIVVGASREHITAPWVRNEWLRYCWLRDARKDEKRLLIAYTYGDLEIKDLPPEMSRIQGIDGKTSMNPREQLISTVLKAVGREEKQPPQPLQPPKPQVQEKKLWPWTGTKPARSAEPKPAEPKPATEIRAEYPLLQANNALITASAQHTAAVRETGCIEYVGWKLKPAEWINIVAVSSSSSHIVGLRRDGTVIARSERLLGNTYCKVDDWRDIVAIAAGETHTVGLKANGTVVAAGNEGNGRCAVAAWTGVVAIAAGEAHTVELKNDGTVAAMGVNRMGQCNVGDWREIVAIAAGANHSVGLRRDGTVVSTGKPRWPQCRVSDWRGIVAIAACDECTVGLRYDGTVVAAGPNRFGECNVTNWSDIIAIATSGRHTVGLKSNGGLVAVGDNKHHECDVFNWQGLKMPK